MSLRLLAFFWPGGLVHHLRVDRHAAPKFELTNTRVDCIILGEIVILGFSVGGMLTLATADKIFNAKVYHARPPAPRDCRVVKACLQVCCRLYREESSGCRILVMTRRLLVREGSFRPYILRSSLFYLFATSRHKAQLPGLISLSLRLLFQWVDMCSNTLPVQGSSSHLAASAFEVDEGNVTSSYIGFV